MNMQTKSSGRLRLARELTGRSQRAVAEKIGYDTGYLSRVERGLQRPTVDFLAKLLRELGHKDVADGIERFWP